MLRYAPADGLQALQIRGIRDETVFATPSLLREAPGLLGYYRLLLGISQKSFYTTKTGLSIFRSMEDRQVVGPTAKEQLDYLCQQINLALRDLVVALPADSLPDDIEQLPLLTLGAQADGAWRGQIGQKATANVFEAMVVIISDHKGQDMVRTGSSVTVQNSAGRVVTLALAPDPDVVIRETVNGQSVYKAAIEIKGGTDYANLHNRVGEAEKSHQKARADGARDCWTVISLDRADIAKLKQESPSTREWFDLNEVVEMDGPSWDRLVNVTITAMGI